MPPVEETILKKIIFLPKRNDSENFRRITNNKRTTKKSRKLQREKISGKLIKINRRGIPPPGGGGKDTVMATLTQSCF